MLLPLLQNNLLGESGTTPKFELLAHTIVFASVAPSLVLNALAPRSAVFDSVSNSLVMTGTVFPLSMLLSEDGDDILQENGLPIALEQ